MFERGSEVVGVVLDVPAVTQEDERQAGVADDRLGGLVLRGQRQTGGVGVEDACVRDEADAGRDGRIHDVAVLGRALADLVGGDQQQFVRAGEGRGERLGPGVVGLPNLHAAGGEVGGLLRAAHGRDDVAGGHAAFQQLLDDKAAEVPGGAGNSDHSFLPGGRSGVACPCGRHSRSVLTICKCSYLG